MHTVNNEKKLYPFLNINLLFYFVWIFHSANLKFSCVQFLPIFIHRRKKVFLKLLYVKFLPEFYSFLSTFQRMDNFANELHENERKSDWSVDEMTVLSVLWVVKYFFFFFFWIRNTDCMSTNRENQENREIDDN